MGKVGKVGGMTKKMEVLLCGIGKRGIFATITTYERWELTYLTL
jgi:hypothetical protein